MVSSRAVLTARVLAGALLSLAACGCFEYNEELTLNRDGTGTVRISGWIDAKVAEAFYSGEANTQLMPPITRGIANDMSVGTSDVRVAAFSSTLEGGKWLYDVTFEMVDLDALGAARFFRQREILLRYATAKQTRFSCYIEPSLLRLARDQAQVYKDNPYSEKLLAAMDSDDFKKSVSEAPLTYKVTLPGAKISGNATRMDIDPSGETVSAVWEYRLSEIHESEKAPRFELTFPVAETAQAPGTGP